MTGPPSNGTFLRPPGDQNATQAPSAETTGSWASSVPARGRASAAPRSRTYSCRTPLPRRPTNTSNRPSGVHVSALVVPPIGVHGPNVLVTCSAGAMLSSDRVTGGGDTRGRERAHSQEPRAPVSRAPPMTRAVARSIRQTLAVGRALVIAAPADVQNPAQFTREIVSGVGTIRQAALPDNAAPAGRGRVGSPVAASTTARPHARESRPSRLPRSFPRRHAFP